MAFEVNDTDHPGTGLLMLRANTLLLSSEYGEMYRRPPAYPVVFMLPLIE